MAEAWFPVAVSAAFGPVLGLIGVSYAVVSGQAGRPGWGRGWVVGLVWAGLVYAGTLLTLAVVARLSGQPGHVVFTFSVVGLIGSAVFGPLVGSAGRRFDEIEALRMRAADLG